MSEQMILLAVGAVVTVVTGAIGPWWAGKMADATARARSGEAKQRALENLIGNKHVYEGARVESLRINGNGGLERLFGPCKITDLTHGFIEVTDDTGRRMNFGCEEWVDLHPVFAPIGGNVNPPEAVIYGEPGSVRIKIGFTEGEQQFDPCLVSSIEDSYETIDDAKKMLERIRFGGGIKEA